MAKKKLTKNPPADHQARIETVLKAVFRGGESTPVVIDLSDEVQPNKKFPLTLTQPQRLSLLEHLDLDPSLKKKIRDAGDGKQVVIVTKKELDQLNDKIGRAAVDAPAPHRKRLLETTLATLRRRSPRNLLPSPRRPSISSRSPSWASSPESGDGSRSLIASSIRSTTTFKQQWDGAIPISTTSSSSEHGMGFPSGLTIPTFGQK